MIFRGISRTTGEVVEGNQIYYQFDKTMIVKITSTCTTMTAIKEGSLQLIPEEDVDFGERKEAIHE